MGISIKNDEVERDIRRLAEITGKGVTEAVAEAVKAALARQRVGAENSEEERQGQIDDLLADLRSRTVADHREHGDMLYGNDGLPR